MVEDVSEDTLQFQANAFRHHYVLPDAEVHVPVGQAKDVAVAAVLVIQTQNRIAEVVNGRYALLEHIDGQPAGGVVVIGMAVRNRGNLNGVFVAEEVDVVPCSVLLAISGRGENLDRRAGLPAVNTDAKDQPPSARPIEPMLSLEERRLVDEESVVDELAIIVLVAVRGPQIERIIRSDLAGSLDNTSRSQRLGPGEVRLQGQSSPIGHLEGGKAGVIVSVTYAAVTCNARRELAGVVQHGGSGEDAPLPPLAMVCIGPASKSLQMLQT